MIRPVTAEEHKQGHAPCHCGEFTHIFGISAARRLPSGYSGEMCQRCSLWMCRVDKLTPVDAEDRQEQP